MQASETLQIILIVAAIAACAAAVYALIEVAMTARSTRALADDGRVTLIPLIEKVDVTVDAINAELLRIDAIVTQFEEVSDRVNSTTHAVQDVVNAPLEAVTAVGTGVRGVVSAWRARRNS